MNDKEFLVYEKRGILSNSPLSGGDGHNVEALERFLEVIRTINEQKVKKK